MSGSMGDLKHFRELRGKLERCGIGVESIERTSRNHARIRVRYLQHRSLIHCGGTPSDHRWLDNTVADAKRALREQGAVFACDKPAAEPQQQELPVAAQASEPGAAPPSDPPDPPQPRKACKTRVRLKAADQEALVDLYNSGIPMVECAEAYNVSPSTGYEYFKEVTHRRAIAAARKERAAGGKPEVVLEEASPPVHVIEPTPEPAPARPSPLDPRLLEMSAKIGKLEELGALIAEQARELGIVVRVQITSEWAA